MNHIGEAKDSGSTLIDQAVEELKAILNKQTDFDGQVILLFSGGRDSSIVASTFCRAYTDGKLMLFFMNNGILHDKMAAYRQYELIKKLNPNVDISFVEKQVWKVMNKAAMQEIEKDFIKYKFSTLLVCIACKLILTFAVIDYAKEIGIKYILDGSSIRQNHFPEQTQVFLEKRDKIFLENGLYCISPLYNFLADKEKIIDTLNAFGIIEKQEATCMFAHSFSEAHECEIRQYIEKSIDIIQRKMIEEGGYE